MANSVVDVTFPTLGNAPVISLSENPLTEEFNPGTMQGQICLELTQGPLDGKWFTDSYLD